MTTEVFIASAFTGYCVYHRYRLDSLIYLGHSIIENTCTMNNIADENQDVAGVYLANYKKYHDQEWNPVYDMMLHYLNFYYLKPFKQD
jgi:hypothetical protein